MLVKGWSGKCVTCAHPKRTHETKSTFSLSVLVPKAAKKDCPSCRGTGMVEYEGTWIFCTTCLGEERCSALWTWISQRFAPKEARVRTRSRRW